ncbi:MAG: hypothetical protein DRQ37_00465 [Gammaproteobacteria bacterium]|nr:MAG: hypothetical protein DRQ37_00465 [Gammaproteobacteria bacterium]
MPDLIRHPGFLDCGLRRNDGNGDHAGLVPVSSAFLDCGPRLREGKLCAAMTGTVARQPPPNSSGFTVFTPTYGLTLGRWQVNIPRLAQRTWQGGRGNE